MKFDQFLRSYLKYKKATFLWTTVHYLHLFADLEFSRLESWSRDVSRPDFTSFGLGLGLEP